MITGGLISQVNPLAANSVTARVGALTHPEQDKSDDSAMKIRRSHSSTACAYLRSLKLLKNHLARSRK